MNCRYCKLISDKLETPMVQITRHWWECPECHALAHVALDHFWSTPWDGPSYNVQWVTDPITIEQVL